MVKTLKLLYIVCFFSFNYNSASALFEGKNLSLTSLKSSLHSTATSSLSNGLKKISDKVEKVPEGLGKLSQEASLKAKKGREEAKGLVAFLNLLNNDFSFETVKKVLPDLRPVMPKVIQSLRLPSFMKNMLISYFENVSAENFSNNFFVKKMVSYIKKNQKNLFEERFSKIDIFEVSGYLSPVEKVTFFQHIPKIIKLGGSSLNKMYNFNSYIPISFKGAK